MKRIFPLLLAVALAAPFSASRADEVEETLTSALSKYKAGEYSSAGSSLQYALNLINEKKAEKLLAVLPEKIGEWQGGEANSNSLGMLGGGVALSRDYRKGDRSAEIQIMIDSPLVQQMVGLLANPMFAGQMGAKLREVEGEKAMLNPKEGEVSLVVNNTILVKVSASGASEEDLMALVRGVDVKTLKALK